MTNSTWLIGLIMTAAISVGGVKGEELPSLDTRRAESLPDASLSVLRDGSGMPINAEPLEGGIPMGPAEIAPESLDGYEALHEQPYDQFATGDDMLGSQAAPIESTGTWLRRGFWYAEAEAVVWNRHWSRDSRYFAVQDINVISPDFVFPTEGIPGRITQPFDTNRFLMLDGSHPGEDTSVRVTLGNFLFRDSKNRDHTAEFTAFGGGDWEQNRVLASENNFGLFVPFIVSGDNRTFNGSTRQQIDYSSRYASFEGNYRVKWRMGRDQLVMDPNGRWHRAANSGWTYEYLAGLRAMEMRDIMDWRAEDIIRLGDDGTYYIRTDNDMFGFQLGGGFAYETSRWSLGSVSKGGVFVNDVLGRSTLNFTADDTNDFDLRMTEDELSFVGETKLIGKWHLTPNISLRASYEVMLLTSQAVAPVQANFISVFSKVNTSRDLWYQGASFGVESYW